MTLGGKMIVLLASLREKRKVGFDLLKCAWFVWIGDEEVCDGIENCEGVGMPMDALNFFELLSLILFSIITNENERIGVQVFQKVVELPLLVFG